jgi:hypothetical protein
MRMSVSHSQRVVCSVSIAATVQDDNVLWVHYTVARKAPRGRINDILCVGFTAVSAASFARLRYEGHSVLDISIAAYKRDLKREHNSLLIAPNYSTENPVMQLD